MARYTTQQEFSFGDNQDTRIVVVNGSVTVNAWDGQDWILDDTLATGTAEYFTVNARLQFIPDVGSSFYIDEGGL